MTLREIELAKTSYKQWARSSQTVKTQFSVVMEALVLPCGLGQQFPTFLAGTNAPMRI